MCNGKRDLELPCTRGSGYGLTCTRGRGARLTCTGGRDDGLTCTWGKGKGSVCTNGRGLELICFNGRGKELTFTRGRSLGWMSAGERGLGLTCTTGRDLGLSCTNVSIIPADGQYPQRTSLSWRKVSDNYLSNVNFAIQCTFRFLLFLSFSLSFSSLDERERKLGMRTNLNVHWMAKSTLLGYFWTPFSRTGMLVEHIYCGSELNWS